MNWKTSLDRYLTTEPYDPFQEWAERVADSLPDWFYKANEDWVDEYSGTYNKWVNYLFEGCYSVEEAVNLIVKTKTKQNEHS